MQPTGLTGQPIHPGSWFGLPDFGVTEAIGSLFGSPTTAQGGSALHSAGILSGMSAPATTYNVGGQTYNAPTLSGGQSTSPSNPFPSNPTPSGNNNGSGGGNGGNPWDYLTPQWGSAAQAHYGDLQRQQDAENASRKAAQDAYNAENSRLNTQFDQSAANINAQLPQLQNEYNKSLNDYQNVYNDAQNQYNTSKTNAQQNTEQQINEAGNVAHETQNQNRNILRALGIGGGTYAGELLSKPLTVYDQQRGQLNQALGARMTELDNFLNQKAQEHTQAVQYLKTNYDNLVGKIQADTRFNDRQRNDALQTANASLSQRLADVQMSMLNYQQSVQLQKQNLANDLLKIQMWTNPTAAQLGSQEALKNLGYGMPTGVNIIGGVPIKKDQNQYLSSGLGQ